MSFANRSKLLPLSLVIVALVACAREPEITEVPPVSYTYSPTSPACVAGGTTSVIVTVVDLSPTPTISFAPHDPNIGVTVVGWTATVRCFAPGTSSLGFTIIGGGLSFGGDIPITISARRDSAAASR